MAKGIVTLSDSNFETEVLQSSVPVLVDFWAPWCMPCQRIAPIVEGMATSHEGKLKVAKLNIDESQAVAQRFNVMSIPTLLLFKNGQAVKQVVGAVPKAQIEDMVKDAI